jgi:hypothetical protein
MYVARAELNTDTCSNSGKECSDTLVMARMGRHGHDDERRKKVKMKGSTLTLAGTSSEP